VDVDPVASMRCWAITVELGGREYEIPALPAVDWWPVLVGLDPSKVLDLLRSEDEAGEFELDTMLLDGRVTGKELGVALTDAIEEATGRSLHVSFILAMVAASQWPTIGGYLAQTGFRWDLQPIGAALDAIYGVVVSNLEKEPREKFLAVLENESLTNGKPSERQQAKIMSEFESMAGPRPAPAPLPGKASGAPSDSPRPRTRTRPRQPRQGGRSGEPKTQP
jgi:hypothetical protein